MGPRLLTVNTGNDISAALEVAFYTFLHLRHDRLCGRRGKVHRRGFAIGLEMVNEARAQLDENEWLAALAELCSIRHEIAHDVGGNLDVEHEWESFLVSVTSST